MSVNNITQRYDQAHDVLYLTLGNPCPSTGEPLNDFDSVVVKYALDDDEICGVTILSFSKLDKNRLFNALPPQFAKVIQNTL